MLWGASWWLEVSMISPTLVYPAGCWVPLVQIQASLQASSAWIQAVLKAVRPISSPSQRDPRHGVAMGQARNMAAQLGRAQGSPSPKEKWKPLVVQGIFPSLGVLAPLDGMVLELALEITQGKPVNAFSQEKCPLSQILLSLSAPRTRGCNLQDWGHLRTIFLQQIQAW